MVQKLKIQLLEGGADARALKKKLTKFGNLGNFPATQILREINFKESGVSKPAFLIVSTPLKFGF